MEKTAVIQEAYDLGGAELKVEKFGPGHIHVTYLVTAGDAKYIFQSSNKNVFKFPERISANHQILSQYIQGIFISFILTMPIINLHEVYFTEQVGQLELLFGFVEGTLKV